MIINTNLTLQAPNPQNGKTHTIRRQSQRVKRQRNLDAVTQMPERLAEISLNNTYSSYFHLISTPQFYLRFEKNLVQDDVHTKPISSSSVLCLSFWFS